MEKTTPSTLQQVARVTVPELDVLRALAAILMIVNHAGFRLLSNDDATSSIAGSAVFLGSFAPVVFFFSTGFGIALATHAHRRPPALLSTLWKTFLLIVADQFFFWNSGQAWGIDFFGFIGLASISVALVARARRPSMWCVGLILGLLALRYGIGPQAREHLHGGRFVDWLFGVDAVPNVSYPLTPWMVYPLLGFIVGRCYRPVRSRPRRQRDFPLVVSLALLFGLSALSLTMAWRGSTFFRWGTVSAAYFVLSLAVLLLTGLLSAYITLSHPVLARRIALRGVTSFLVIPLHYALLDLCAAVLPLPVAPALFAVIGLAVVILSFVLSFRFADVVSDLWSRQSRRLTFPLLMTLLAAFGGATVWAAQGKEAAVFVLLGQLVVAALLSLRFGRPGSRLTPALVPPPENR